ncbi:PGR5-like protein 1B, chloroplastic [Actinidia eriantha]|uniref:PGR5-like protein 1B, chloroplastic n=1 Tax=Actinidia eriantha TaxID=165200 RepID=UPI00258AB3E6|nr:PGR5-like protein 1B, chloroplastic [Actinidia eriantha]
MPFRRAHANILFRLLCSVVKGPFLVPLLLAGQVQEDEVVDSKILEYCSIDKKEKKSLGELEQEFLQALQAFYYEGKAVMSNEEFDNLKEELMWEGSSVCHAKYRLKPPPLRSAEQKFLEASMAYVAGKPILSDEEYDNYMLIYIFFLWVYSDLAVDYLNVPAAVVALGLYSWHMFDTV